MIRSGRFRDVVFGAKGLVVNFWSLGIGSGMPILFASWGGNS